MGIALLGVLHYSVATTGGGGRRRDIRNVRRRCREKGPLLDLTGARAAVTRDGVVIVALLGARTDTIATQYDAHAGCSLADPAKLALAGSGTAITGDQVAVVTLLGGFDDAIAADRDSETGRKARL